MPGGFANKTLGVVLAGGVGRRMGGVDKSRIRIGDATILSRLRERFEPQCAKLLLSANGDTARFADTDLVVVADDEADNAGPLAGILAALDWSARHAPEIDWIVSVPADCPFLPRDLVARLHQARVDGGMPLACAASAQRLHPVIGLWPVALRDDLRQALRGEGLRKVELWAARHGIARAAWPIAPFDPFFNVNTPDDVAKANRIAALFPEA